MTSDIDWKMLRHKATEAATRAYAPYSGFSVGRRGAGGRPPDGGRLQCGECLIWPRSLCRVRSGLRPVFRRRRQAVALSCVDAAGEVADAVRAVRQVLLEHGGPEMLIDHPLGPRPLGELLPDAFGPDDLARRDERARGNRRDAGFTFDAPTVIRTKRDGGVLSDAAIDWVIDAYTRRPGRRRADVGVADGDLLARHDRVARSPAGRRRWWPPGERLDFTDLRRDGKPLALVDKHSTGGVGDKITIPLVPVVMACGGAVPQAAGRGLGHTGGTLDKLESIRDSPPNCPKRRSGNNFAISARRSSPPGSSPPPTARSTRCATSPATTESLPLIASSVMSKKIAEGTEALVLDSKVGAGAFLKTEAESRELARTMVALGTAAGLHDPRAADRHVDAAGPRRRQRRRGRRVAGGAGRRRARRRGGADAGAGRRDARRRRAGRRRSRADAARRHGDGPLPRRWSPRRAATCRRELPIGAYSETITAPRGGTMGDIDAMAVGLAVWRLGAGRSVPGERVQFGAGLHIHRRPRRAVAAGEAGVHALHRDPGTVRGARWPSWTAAGASATRRPPERPLIIDRIPTSPK